MRHALKKILAALLCGAMLFSALTVMALPGGAAVTAGDINGDGSVNNKDLTRLFQHLSEWEVAVNEAVLDVNGDGSVNNKDLTRLFQFLSEWEVKIYPQSICEHNGGIEIRNAVEPTCVNDGYSGDTYCLICDEKIADGETVPATGLHSGGEATCHTLAVCSTCGAEYGEYNASNHTGETQIAGAVAPSGAEYGYTGDEICLGCGAVLSYGIYYDDSHTHEGSAATYYQKGACDICGKQYYAQMYTYDCLTDTQKQLYDVIKNSVVNLEKKSIYLFEYLDDPETGESDINVVIRAISYDHPEYFWMPRSFSVGKTTVQSTGVITDISLSFADSHDPARGQYHVTAAEKVAMQAQLEAKINEIIALASQYDTDFEKEVFLHDYLCENIVYNTAAANDPTVDYFSFTAYGALINGTCVCEGYSRAMQLLCQRLDIPCGLITGTYLANVPVNSYICITCGNIYDASETGVSFDDLPDDYVCEICQGAKDNFVKYYTLFTLRCVCNKCGWYFDEDTRGVKWDELPDSFTCENCGTNKDSFILLSKTPHMWNIINPGDGCYYLDITFDDLDEDTYPKLCTHYCFNITTEETALDHVFDEQYDRQGDYSDSSLEYNFFDTHGDRSAMNYYLKRGAYITTDNLEQVAAYINDLKNSGVEIADFLYDDENITPTDAMKAINRILTNDYGFEYRLPYGYGYYENWMFVLLVTP